MAVAPRTASMHLGCRVRWLLIDYSLSYGHHGLSPCSTHPGEGTVSLAWAEGPILTPETTGHTPAAQCSSAVGAPFEANLHPNSQYMSPAAAKQASAVHLTVCKPMASHRTALHTHEPPLWHMGPTAPKFMAVWRLCGAGTESEPPRQVRR